MSGLGEVALSLEGGVAEFRREESLRLEGRGL